MAQVTVQRYAAELGRLPPACICCGQPAQQMVRHKFYYDPLWLIVLSPVLGIFRYIWASQSLVILAPVCPRHGWRLGLPTYIGYFFAVSLLIFAPLLIASSQVPAIRGAEGYIWLAVFLYVLGMLALMLAVRLATPRMVDFDTGSVTFGSVSLGFKAAITGQALPGQGLRSVGLPVADASIGMSGAYAPGLRSPATNNGPLLALMGIGGGLAVLVVLGLVFVGAYYVNRARRNAEVRRLQASGIAAHEKARADAQANHQRIMAEHEANLRRTASAPAKASAPAMASPPAKSSPPPSLPTITAPSSTLPTSITPSSATPPKPAAPTPPPPPPPQTTSTSPPATTDTSPILPVPDPFGIGQQIGPPGTISAGGIPPKPRPDLEAKADEPIRGRFDKPDPRAGPDGLVEVVYRPQSNDPPFPSTSKPLTRVTDLRVGMEIWIQDGFRRWYRGTVTGIDGLRAMVHQYGSDPINDELVPIPRIRLAGDVQQPAADARNPFEDPPERGPPPVAQRKRTWTDSTGKFTIVAEFVKLASGKVTLKREDGSEIALPLEMLAAADQQIAKQLGGM